MNPTFRIIFFTVASSAGYGLLALLGLVGNAHGKASSMAFGLTAMAVVLALITVGLFSPSQRRSSWLSRARIAAAINYLIALSFGCVWSGLIDAPALIAPLGILTALTCAITAFCTAVSNRSLKTNTARHNKFIVLVYLAFALATGSGLLNVISFIFGRFQTDAGKFMALLTVALILIAITLKWFERSNHNRKLQIIMFALLSMGLVLTLLSLILPWLTFIVALLILVAAWTERWHFFA